MDEKEKSNKIDTSVDVAPIELVPVRGDDVKIFLMDNFEDMTEWKKVRQSMYELHSKNDQGCYFSVKVPDNVHEAGKALHINVRYKKGDKDYPVYPSQKMGQNLGQGGFVSKSVHRDKRWQQNLLLEAKTGKEICKVLYDKKRFYNDNQKKIIYDTFDQRIETRDTLTKQHNHCKKLSQESAISKCKEKEKELESTLDNINKKIRTWLD